MKIERDSHRKRLGSFTLVELLVVMAIIGVMAAILLPALNAALERAERSRADHQLHQILAAMKAYFGEYGSMPTPDSQGDQDYSYGSKSCSRKQNVVMNILRGIDTTNNTKAIEFLDVPLESLEGTDKDGNSYSESDGFYLDPWGNPYMIALDCDYDGSLEISGLGEPADGYLRDLSAAGDGVFPGLTMGVMSYGPRPEKSTSFMTSW